MKKITNWLVIKLKVPLSIIKLGIIGYYVYKVIMGFILCRGIQFQEINKEVELWKLPDYSIIDIDTRYRSAKEFYGKFVNDERIPVWYRNPNPIRGGA